MQAPLTGHTVLYGGSFDPPHLGHQMACLALLEGLGAEAVWLIPADKHPFHKALTPFVHRVAMCRLMAAPLGTRVQVQQTEHTLGGAGRTYDLVMHLQGQHPQVCFALAIGADLVPDTPRWYRWQAIAAAVRVVVLGRAGYAAAAHTPPLPPIASHQIRQAVGREQSLNGQVPLEVVRYMACHKLYVSPC